MVLALSCTYFSSPCSTKFKRKQQGSSQTFTSPPSAKQSLRSTKFKRKQQAKYWGCMSLKQVLHPTKFKRKQQVLDSTPILGTVVCNCKQNSKENSKFYTCQIRLSLTFGRNPTKFKRKQQVFATSLSFGSCVALTKFKRKQQETCARLPPAHTSQQKQQNSKENSKIQQVHRIAFSSYQQSTKFKRKQQVWNPSHSSTSLFPRYMTKFKRKQQVNSSSLKYLGSSFCTKFKRKQQVGYRYHPSLSPKVPRDKIQKKIASTHPLLLG